MFANTENCMTLRVLDTAQWERCAAKLLSIPAIILLFGETQKCLYLSQISTDFNSVKKHMFASVLPHLLSTHLTSSFNIWMVQIWPRTFPLCNDNMMEDGDTEETLQDSGLRLCEEDEIKEELESEEINNDESVLCEICPLAI